MRNDVVVLVRNSVGAPLARYHNAAWPCGSASGRGFSRKLEGEAREHGLRRCRHCNWPAASGGAGECVMALGINKDLEPLARRVRHEGGQVHINRRNHVVWEMPDGSRLRTGLTMSGSTAHLKRRQIERALNAWKGTGRA